MYLHIDLNWKHLIPTFNVSSLFANMRGLSSLFRPSSTHYWQLNRGWFLPSRECQMLPVSNGMLHASAKSNLDLWAFARILPSSICVEMVKIPYLRESAKAALILCPSPSFSPSFSPSSPRADERGKGADMTANRR